MTTTKVINSKIEFEHYISLLSDKDRQTLLTAVYGDKEAVFEMISDDEEETT